MDRPPSSVMPVDPVRPAPAVVSAAAAVLRDGGLVAFPTETVYGLGAAIDHDDALARVFAVKGRPATDPLIVHVPSAGDARAVVAGWDDRAEALATAFWPGPLTLVLPRGPQVPDAVTAGGPAVGVRVPAHPVALALLRAAAVPVAAPSANRFGRVSPTTAAHVVEELGDGPDVVLDGGPTPLGVESTVLDLTGGRPRLLRPGGVGLEDLAAVLGPVEAAAREVVDEATAAEAPGRFLGHYAPATTVVLVEGDGALRAELLRAAAGRGLAAAPLDLPAGGDEAAAVLYRRLREADDLGADVVLAVVVDPAGVGRAVNDRLFRAAHGRVLSGADEAAVDRLVALARPWDTRP